jgi:hypothetical protein
MDDLLAVILPAGAALLVVLAFPWWRARGAAGLRLILWSGCLAILLPRILCLWWCGPSLDDWTYGAAGRTDWWGTQVSSYWNWSGRIAATALLSSWSLGLPPDWACRFAYPIELLALWTWLTIALHAVVVLVLPVETKRTDRFLVTATLLTAWVVGMPNPVEGMYWLAGAVTYQGGIACALSAIALLLRGRIFCGVALSGCAPLFAETVTVLFIPVLTIVAWYRPTARPAWLFALVSATLLFTCPGHAHRLAQAEVPPPAWTWSLWLGGFRSFGADAAWWAMLPLLAVAHVLPAPPRPTTKQVFSAVLAAGLAVLLVLTPQIATGLGATRANNPLWLVLVALAGWIAWNKRDSPWLVPTVWAFVLLLYVLSADALALILGLSTIILLAAWGRGIRWRERVLVSTWLAIILLVASPRWWTVVIDAFIGGPTYAIRLSARWQTLSTASPIGIVTVPRLPVDVPRTFHREDLHIAADTWQNQGCAQFFGLAAVRAVPLDEQP